jgi:hypothetical protein
MGVRLRWAVLRLGLLGLLVAGATLTALVGSSAAAPGLPAGCRPAPGVIRCTFVYTGRAQTWTVPAGVTEATFDVYGAQGADIAGFTQGGLGGHATADLASLTPGAPVTVVVGGQGQGGSSPGAAEVRPTCLGPDLRTAGAEAEAPAATARAR